MPRPPFRIAMFLSSYSPLFGLLAYTNHETPWAWRILGTVAIVSVFGLVTVLLANRNEHGPLLTVVHSRPKDGDVLAYIATYLIPFLALDLSKTQEVVTLCVFLLVLMVVYINSSMLFVNPLLSIAGYHSFEVEDPDGHVYTLITQRHDLEPGAVLRPAQMNRYIRVEVCRDRQDQPH
jgi:hypothetical protein